MATWVGGIRTVRYRSEGFTGFTLARTCPRCAGSGRYGPTCVWGGVCFACKGSTVVRLAPSGAARVFASLERFAAALGGRKLPRAARAPRAVAGWRPEVPPAWEIG